MVVMATAITATVATIVCSVEAISIANTFSRGLILQSLKYSMESVLGTVSKITKFDQPTIKQVTNALINTDIKHKVELIQILFEELKELKEHYDSKSIDFALFSLVEQMNLINKDLDTIKYAIDEHVKKYLVNWRILCCKNEIESIVQKKIILDSRYKELIGLLGLHKLLSSSKSTTIPDKRFNDQLKIEDSPTSTLTLTSTPTSTESGLELSTFNSKSWLSNLQDYVVPYSLLKQKI